MNNRPSNTLSVIGLVIAIIAVIFSFIPCIGTIAFIPGLISLVLGVIAYLKAKDNGHPKGMPIAVIIISLVACAFSAFQWYTINNMVEDTKEYTNCEELIKDYNASQAELKTISEEMEEDDSKALSNITTIAKLGMRIGNMQEQAEELGCELEFDGFEDASEDVNPVTGEEVEAESDAGAKEGNEEE